jgi:hypothetical protein
MPYGNISNGSKTLVLDYKSYTLDMERRANGITRPLQIRSATSGTIDLSPMWTTGGASLVSLFVQSRARIGAAVAKRIALRALGTSAMGVSKVFLRHIAPALYRDQDLASGPHFSAGHAQCSA